MNSPEIRNSFIDFFKERKHTIVSSDSLVPSSDPTLLFSSAGMVQFKKHFLGEIKSDYTRAASCQKCFRTSDIEKIGLTARHLTFFEMLGNFSFGDYFKKDAIHWAWEYVTQTLKLPEKNLYFTIFKDDEESETIWKKIVPAQRITKLGEHSNFWNMGPTGPCGPCSEILWDLGPDVGCGKSTCGPGCDCDRFLEVWNLVFTQFDRQKDGSLGPLPKKNIDTGMGLERLVLVVQNKKSPFETDLFKPIIDEFSGLTGLSSSDVKYQRHSRLIADHVRAAAFLVSDGILPSNEGRGYVLRRIMRRAIRSGKHMGIKEPFLYRLTALVSTVMKDVYPELHNRRENIASIIKLEEEKFYETLETGMRILDDLIYRYPSIIPGDEVFKLYDTYGFPFELTQEIAAEKNRQLDSSGFNQAMQKAQELSRKSWKGSGTMDISYFTSLHKKYGDTEFKGYETHTVKTIVKILLQNKQEKNILSKGEEGEVVLKETPFYGESGGQTGDTGVLKNEKNKFRAAVLSTAKPLDKFIVHAIKIEDGNISVGDAVDAVVDIEKRMAVMRHHTATHLLHKALRQVLGTHVAQSGSLVAPDRLRFDYTHPSSPKKEELDRVEEIVNDAILKNLTVHISEISIEEARKAGAMALFGEKYGKVVRCVRVGDDVKNPFSIELCGGTHMQATGGIGLFKIISDASIASGVRRIEAVAGKEAYRYIKNTELLIDSWAEKLRVSPKDISVRLDKLIQNQKSSEKEIADLKRKLTTQPKEDLSKDIFKVNDLHVFIRRIRDSDLGSLRTEVDHLADSMKLDIALVATDKDGKTSFVVRANESAQKKGLNAGAISKKFGALINGSGGGRPDFAQGGGKDPSLIDNALTQIKDFIKNFK